MDPSRPIHIDEGGRVAQDGRVVAQLHVVRADGGSLVKAGANLFRFADPAQPNLGAFDGRVRQGFTEASGVDPIKTINNMMNAAKAAQSNLKMMQYHDHIIGQTVNTFGRVA